MKFKNNLFSVAQSKGTSIFPLRRKNLFHITESIEMEVNTTNHAIYSLYKVN